MILTLFFNAILIALYPIAVPISKTLVIPLSFITWFRTNGAASESKYQLFDIYGNKLFERSGMSNNTTYKDTFNLGVGCYQFVVLDSDDDGINDIATT